MVQTETAELFYKEHDPVKRQELLRGMEEGPETDLRRELFRRRHPDEARKNDYYMRSFLDFQFFAEQETLFAGFNARKIRKIYAAMGSEAAAAAGDIGAELFYREIRNAAERYFETTAHEGQGRKMFGVVAADDARRNADRCEEAWKMSIGLVTKYNLAEELDILRRAVIDTYCATDDDARQRLDAYDLKRRPGRAEQGMN